MKSGTRRETQEDFVPTVKMGLSSDVGTCDRQPSARADLRAVGSAMSVALGKRPRSAGGAGSDRTCVHGRSQGGYLCKECPGKGICEHGRQRSHCKECGGSSICEHGRVRSHCKECGGPECDTIASLVSRLRHRMSSRPLSALAPLAPLAPLTAR